MMKAKTITALAALTLIGCGKDVTVHVPPPPAPIVVDGGIVCSTSLFAYHKIDAAHCPANEVMVGHADNGIECAISVTKCWIEKP